MIRSTAVLLLCVLLGGCATVGYYGQAVRGHWQVMAARQPIEALIQDPQTPAPLAAQLRYARDVLQFAHNALDLPDNGNFRDYADIGRPYVVWNVFAAPEFSLQPRQSCFPLIGCVSYRGYYAEEAARTHAAQLAGQGNDVFVGGVAAYSTLGFFDDPLLSSMLRWDELRLAEVLFHELAHSVAYAADDTGFNESFATAVQIEGLRRWAQRQDQPEWAAQVAAEHADRALALSLIADARSELQVLYAGDASAETRRERKQAILDDLARRYAEQGNGTHAGWFGGDLNNARLVALADYQDHVPAFERLLAAVEGDLPCFYTEVKKAAKSDAATRGAWLLHWSAGTAEAPVCQ